MNKSTLTIKDIKTQNLNSLPDRITALYCRLSAEDEKRKPNYLKRFPTRNKFSLKWLCVKICQIHSSLWTMVSQVRMLRDQIFN